MRTWTKLHSTLCLLHNGIQKYCKVILAFLHSHLRMKKTTTKRHSIFHINSKLCVKEIHYVVARWAWQNIPINGKLYSCNLYIVSVQRQKGLSIFLTLKVLNFWKFTSNCSLKPLWSGMGEVVPARTSPTLHPPSPAMVHQLSRLALEELRQ